MLMDLVDPTVQQELLDAQLQLKAAQTDLTNIKAKLQSDLMTQKAGAATVNADYQPGEAAGTDGQDRCTTWA